MLPFGNLTLGMQRLTSLLTRLCNSVRRPGEIW
jgi:hypothetical protein